MARTRPPHSPHIAEPTHLCALTGRRLPERDGTHLDLLRPALQDSIRAAHPGIAPDAFLSHEALARERARYVAETLQAERGDLGALERDVITSLAQNDLLTQNVEAEFEQNRSFGERAADLIARFGGSWTFILCFGGFLVVWMALNAVSLRIAAFDPYPYILLNLVLSCIAALQAPIIMMSQRRQETKDRSRSENDYRVNLKAELEIRHLHEKIDHMLNRQWERLAEIQAIQLELMEDLARRRS
ncbi:DUF1003 domain-containing protein [Ancylobacter sp. 6x-1]|uniref:DUF1003 domain-containing protein n=1 Tax=Ancylobacter crimeensis TaxID=2579147 RepID=A0ABT0DDL2_9HYPH|nr:DUF1003 domain-containing protein [Ancylobacter crimeensis]MCK0198059.1 DUF1003 domain-containing protein [Ancylobacter crimeensis]